LVVDAEQLGCVSRPYHFFDLRDDECLRLLERLERVVRLARLVQAQRIGEQVVRPPRALAGESAEHVHDDLLRVDDEVSRSPALQLARDAPVVYGPIVHEKRVPAVLHRDVKSVDDVLERFGDKFVQRVSRDSLGAFERDPSLCVVRPARELVLVRHVVEVRVYGDGLFEVLRHGLSRDGHEVALERRLRDEHEYLRRDALRDV